MDKPIRRIARVDVTRDPAFPGVMRGVWIDATSTLPTPPNPPPEPFQLVPEMPPAPSTDPEADKKWQAVLALADTVIAQLRAQTDFENELLYKVIKDLIEGNYTAGDVVAIYHHRKQKVSADG